MEICSCLWQSDWDAVGQSVCSLLPMPKIMVGIQWAPSIYRWLLPPSSYFKGRLKHNTDEAKALGCAALHRLNILFKLIEQSVKQLHMLSLQSGDYLAGAGVVPI